MQECDRKHYAKGLCKVHYYRQKNQGVTSKKFGRPIRQRMPKGPRPVTECRHTDRPHGGLGMCRSCYVAEWARKHPESANTGNNWLKNHPEQARLHSRKLVLRKYGLTIEDYAKRWTEQGGRCANLRCRAQFDLIVKDFRFGLQVDHDHSTGRVRGLLCPSCNRTLGHIADDIERLAGLIEYLDLNLNKEGVKYE